MALHLSHLSSLPREPPSVVSPTTAQKMIALTTTATPSVLQNTTITKRPKLSLQTASLPATFGNSNTGLARTCLTASPTVRNTFSNAYEIKQVLSAIESPSPCRSADRGARYGSPFLSNNHRSDAMPYQLPLGVRSILRNSPLKRLTLRRRSVSISAGPVSENRRVYFPARKQVSFRNNLEEEIKTVLFVARHSDIESESELESEFDDGSDSGSDSGSQSEGHSSSGEDEEAQDQPVLKKKRKSVSSERQIRAAALRDGFDDDRIAVALTAGPSGSRRKRRCKWRWTLDNLAPTELASKSSTTPLADLPSPAHLIQGSPPAQTLLSNEPPSNKIYDLS
ncbi:hypothetical protein UA08_04751 [Talaromyces atroroseus]|uniref:Uncharacterized protein n=1 Tax=Talaromyces atroroseus TaxID=1441469 RepID=A0A225B2F2_TALAT|nr:hypothetical protein UA08_04751 [Talaromyces atroroseus]OKL60027.1 hypothetical protein UA08_04751 [Talaromyces atroroseus]